MIGHVILHKVLRCGNEKGATATEYALLLSTIALVILGMIAMFGSALHQHWLDAVSALRDIS